MVGSRTDVIVALPRPLTSLIGREHELNHLYELLRSDVALVTITGFGGIGKTRLSLQAALELEPIFGAGVIFAQLAAVTQGSSIPLAIALTAGLDESIDTVDSLAEALGSSTRLLVLDNLEQIPDAAEAVLSLLQAMPNVTILATSRSRLELSGEHVLPLEPLETQSKDARTLPSVKLFIERAKAANPSLSTDDDAIEIIAEICQKLDGIPLAIELAAARLAIFSLTDLRDQLIHILPVLASKRVDMPDRQRTMRNAIAWTYELLEQPERRLFTWLAVYEQDFSLESVRHVATQLELTEDPLDIVQFLVSRSLVRPSRRDSEAPRYQMLQMLREFGHEQLLLTGEDHIARRSHAMDMVALAERAEPHLTTAEAINWVRLLNSDLPSILGALAWSKKLDEHEIGHRLLGAVWRYAEMVGLAGQFLPLIPKTHEDSGQPHQLARALVGIGYLHEVMQDLQAAQLAFEQALALTGTLDDKELHVRALTGLGTVHFDYSDIPVAQEMLNEARTRATEINYTRGTITSTGMLANIQLQLQHSDEAIKLLQEVLGILEHSGDPRSLGLVLGNLGLAYHINAQHNEAEKYYLQSLEMAREAEDSHGVIVQLVNLGSIAHAQHENDKAMTYIEQGIELARQNGTILHEAILLSNLAETLIHKREWARAAQATAEAATILDNVAGTRHQPDFAFRMQQICMAFNMKDEAAEILGASLAMREKYQAIANTDTAELEEQSVTTLNAENKPRYSRIMANAAGYDRSTLVKRMQEIAEIIIAKSPQELDVSPRKRNIGPALTPREIEVVSMAAKGLTNAEIADEMFVSKRTITTHLTNIFGKLEVKNRAGAIAIATAQGLL